jgi:hypothetical protein
MVFTCPKFTIGDHPMRSLAFAIFWILPASTLAHDACVQTNTNLVREGDAVHIDLMLGNHGNAHPDFRLAGRESLMADLILGRMPRIDPAPFRLGREPAAAVADAFRS